MTLIDDIKKHAGLSTQCEMPPGPKMAAKSMVTLPNRRLGSTPRPTHFVDMSRTAVNYFTMRGTFETVARQKRVLYRKADQWLAIVTVTSPELLQGMPDCLDDILITKFHDFFEGTSHEVQGLLYSDGSNVPDPYLNKEKPAVPTPSESDQENMHILTHPAPVSNSTIVERGSNIALGIILGIDVGYSSMDGPNIEKDYQTRYRITTKSSPTGPRIQVYQRQLIMRPDNTHEIWEVTSPSCLVLGDDREPIVQGLLHISNTYIHKRLIREDKTPKGYLLCEAPNDSVDRHVD